MLQRLNGQLTKLGQLKNNKSDLIKEYLSKVKSANKEITKKEAMRRFNVL